jgi:hypothetical protein
LDQPKLDREIILASSDGSFIEQTEVLQKLIAPDHRQASLRKIKKTDQTVSFYVDLAGIPEWKTLIYDGSRYFLRLKPDYRIQ